MIVVRSLLCQPIRKIKRTPVISTPMLLCRSGQEAACWVDDQDQQVMPCHVALTSKVVRLLPDIELEWDFNAPGTG